MSSTSAPANMMASLIEVLSEDLGLAMEGIQNLLVRIMDEKPTKVGYSPGVGCSPMLKESFDLPDFGNTKFSFRFDWVIGEVFFKYGESDQMILYPHLEELGSGSTMIELVNKLNAVTWKQPWVILRSAGFFFSLFPADEAGRDSLNKFHLIEPHDWWHQHGVPDLALSRFRPGGILWKDLPEKVAGETAWILLGAA